MENTDTLIRYGHGFQTKVISALLSDQKLLNQLFEILSPSYFESDASKWIVSQIIEYYDTYKGTMSLDVFKSKIITIDNDGFKNSIIDQLRSSFTEIGTVDLDYIKDEFKSFCINQNLKGVILKSVDLLKAGEYDRIKTLVDNAMKIGVDVDLGHDYILDFENRMTDEQRNTVKTDWDVINDLMDGGLSGGELGVVVAPSGVGKTWLLTAIGAAAIKQGLNVVHYSMELSEHYVSARYDTVFTHIPSSELKLKKDAVKSAIHKLPGKLIIKYFPPKAVTTKTLALHLEKLKAAGHPAQLIIIDYADLLLSSISSDSTYQEQGGVYIELRGLCGLLNIPAWTASQTNRQGIDSEIIEADKIADSYAKVMNADFIVSWSRKAKDKLNNTARAHIMKNRFGPDGITFPCKMDTNKGIIEIFDGNSTVGMSATKDAEGGEILQKKLLHKKYIDSMG